MAGDQHRGIGGALAAADVNRWRLETEHAALSSTKVADGIYAMSRDTHNRLSTAQRSALIAASYLILHMQAALDQYRAPNPAEAPDDYGSARAEHAKIQEMLARYPSTHQWVLSARLRRARLEARYPELAIVCVSLPCAQAAE